ncbi:hypothetical protein GOBAR_DD20355 [Gossypium barbadense]|nr:hypothetical protein GOBAR_DD20355 [Gossypium barbadense]
MMLYNLRFNQRVGITHRTCLHTYVHPEKAGSANNASFGLRAAARRPFSDSGSQLDGESEPGLGVLINGNLIPVIFGFIGLTKAFLALTKISFENSASKRSEK